MHTFVRAKRTAISADLPSPIKSAVATISPTLAAVGAVPSAIASPTKLRAYGLFFDFFNFYVPLKELFRSHKLELKPEELDITLLLRMIWETPERQKLMKRQLLVAGNRYFDSTHQSAFKVNVSRSLFCLVVA
jgi:hypothetical protein